MTNVNSIAGNDGFSKVRDVKVETSSLLEGVAGAVAALTVPTSNGALAVAALGAAATTVTAAMLASMNETGFLLVDGTAAGAAAALDFGADTAARATTLLESLGISDAVPQRMFTLKHWGGANAAFVADLQNTGAATSTNVQFSLLGSAVAGTQVFAAVSAVSDAYVVVSRGTPATAGEACIQFNIVAAATA